MTKTLTFNNSKQQTSLVTAWSSRTCWAWSISVVTWWFTQLRLAVLHGLKHLLVLTRLEHRNLTSITKSSEIVFLFVASHTCRGQTWLLHIVAERVNAERRHFPGLLDIHCRCPAHQKSQGQVQDSRSHQQTGSYFCHKVSDQMTECALWLIWSSWDERPHASVTAMKSREINADHVHNFIIALYFFFYIFDGSSAYYSTHVTSWSEDNLVMLLPP